VAAITKAMENLGWELVNSDVNNGIVEATGTTTWFGFKDDVVVRINDKGSKRVVDIRNKSRIGKSHLGKNAQRIKTLIEELNAVVVE